MIVELFDASDAARLAAAFAVRTRVFVVEQRVPEEEEIDAHDAPGARTLHALARDGDRVVGAGRYYEVDAGTVQIGRMAVERDARGRGAGRALLDALCVAARERGFVRAHLHAQTHAREFYRKAGFADDGEPMTDAGIPHQPMSAALEDYGSR